MNKKWKIIIEETDITHTLFEKNLNVFSKCVYYLDILTTGLQE